MSTDVHDDSHTFTEYDMLHVKNDRGKESMPCDLSGGSLLSGPRAYAPDAPQPIGLLCGCQAVS
jgi:hypothetical protein